jgi:hypothetical protein
MTCATLSHYQLNGPMNGYETVMVTFPKRVRSVLDIHCAVQGGRGRHGQFYGAHARHKMTKTGDGTFCGVLSVMGGFIVN